MIDRNQFRELVIDPVLKHLDLYSVEASELLLGTAMQESRLTYIKQLGKGPALGLFQMEPATHNDIWSNYLKYKTDLATRVFQLASPHNVREGVVVPDELIGNLNYAAAMCRVHYLRVPKRLPPPGDLGGQAKYWKDAYNTHLGKGTVEEYMKNWRG